MCIFLIPFVPRNRIPLAVSLDAHKRFTSYLLSDTQIWSWKVDWIICQFIWIIFLLLSHVMTVYMSCFSCLQWMYLIIIAHLFTAETGWHWFCYAYHLELMRIIWEDSLEFDIFDVMSISIKPEWMDYENSLLQIIKFALHYVTRVVHFIYIMSLCRSSISF